MNYKVVITELNKHIIVTFKHMQITINNAMHVKFCKRSSLTIKIQFLIFSTL